MLEAIIFDYDGTIGDTMRRQYDWYLSWNAKNSDKPLSCFSNFMAAKDASPGTLKRLKEDPGEKLLVDGGFENFLPLYNRLYALGGGQFVYDAFNLPCDMSDMKHPVWKNYEEFKKDHLVPSFPGMPEAIKTIHEMGDLRQDPTRNHRVRLAINTTNSWASIYPELRHHGILGCFDSHVCAETLVHYDGNGNSKAIMKPSKVSVALSLNILGSAGDSTMFIGDTLSDLKACMNVARTGSYKRESLIPVGVSWGFDGKELLTQGVKTDQGTEYFRHIVDRPEELVELVHDYLRR